MSYPRGILRTGLVWLTAVMTLAAATPQFPCLCPDGTRKPFCLRSALGLGRACCPHGSGCCPDGGAPRAEKSCCHRHAAAPRSSSPQIHGAGCQTALERSKLLAVQSSRAETGDGLALVLPAALPPATRALLPPAPVYGEHRPGHGPGSPPPTDLIVVLQHFLI